MKKKQLLVLISFTLATTVTFTSKPQNKNSDHLKRNIIKLESSYGSRIGLWFYDSKTKKVISHRAKERFPMCSTFKLMLCAAILKKSEKNSSFLEKKVKYSKKDLVTYSPVTKKFTSEGMSVFELCQATLQTSDNTAANLLIEALGGLKKLNNFAKNIGDQSFRLDNKEPYLNSAIPEANENTTTAEAMGQSLEKIFLEDHLSKKSKALLKKWILGSKTGSKRIKAALFDGWKIGNKTGTCGSYGAIGDIAVLWPPKRKPMILVIYLHQNKQKSPNNENVIAKVSHSIFQAL